MISAEHVFLGIDVGTASARAGLFDLTGVPLGTASFPFQTWVPEVDFAEQSTDEIWRAVCSAVREAMAISGVAAERVRGIGFDATCSLVAIGVDGQPVTVSPTGQPHRNVIAWFDHRATMEANEISERGHELLRYVGGRLSPEMQIPKLAWLKRNTGCIADGVTRFFDLADYLTFRATGSEIRSLCTTVCKWGYAGHDPQGGWSRSLFDLAGIGELLDGFARRVGQVVRPVGSKAGSLTAVAAADLGLPQGVPVAVSAIDAHAGGIGVLGLKDPHEAAVHERLALIAGTSTCHMATSYEPLFVPGVWGPYYSAMIPGMWLSEGGQSASGALIDWTLDNHQCAAELREEADGRGVTRYAFLNDVLAEMARTSAEPAVPAALTRNLHILPDHRGNRSPHADAMARGMVSGMTLHSGMESIARAYLATVQALSYGTREILDALNSNGHQITTLVATGGDAKNELFLREHADASGCRIMLPQSTEAVLLGAAMLGAVAADTFSSVQGAMVAMSGAPSQIVHPNSATGGYHERKYGVFKALRRHQLEYRLAMAPPS